MTGRKAASVLPVPVGATSRRFLPAKTIGIASFCGSVGEKNFFSIRSLCSGLTSLEKTPSKVVSRVYNTYLNFDSYRYRLIVTFTRREDC